MRAHLVLLPLGLAASLIACGGDDSSTDGGTDTGTDGATDSSTPDTGTDTGTPMDSGTDSGGGGCTTDCEFVDVVSGATHSCALRANGTIWCWGGNVDGTLGDGRMRHMDCGSAGSTEPQDCSGPVQVLTIDDATAISSRGGLQNCALRESGGTWCWGLQSVPPASGGEAPRRFEPEARVGLEDLETISDGFGHTCGVVSGQAVCIGRNGSGQIGDGTKVEARVAHTVAMPTGVVDVQAASGSSDLTCAITATEAYCWGNNGDGQLGDGVPDHMGGCMGSVTSYDCALTPVAVVLPDGVTFTQIAPGGAHVCAVGSDDNLYCWGANNYGQLGTGDQVGSTTPVQVTDTGDVAFVDAGSDFTCIVRDSGAVECAGDNQEGQIGDGTADHGAGCRGPMGTDCVNTFTAVDGLTDAAALGVGWRHSCAVRDTGDVVCWGYNTKMQLGDGTRDRRNSPVTVMNLGD